MQINATLCAIKTCRYFRGVVFKIAVQINAWEVIPLENSLETKRPYAVLFLRLFCNYDIFVLFVTSVQNHLITTPDTEPKTFL
jgi:hypothetical protein